MQPPSSRFYEFGPFLVDSVKRVLLRAGEPVPLPPKAFDTLLVLVLHAGEVLEKDRLMDLLWPDSAVEEANLPLNISALRKALGETPSERGYITTIPGRGYRFAAEMQVVGAEEPDLILEGRPHEQGTSGVRSIAVLPFKPLISDQRDEFLELGMADALITKLSNIRQIIVRPTSSVRKYMMPEQDPVAAGRELRVEAVLETSIQLVGDRLRVTSRLFRVGDGSSLWAGKFDERFDDILAVQDRVSEQVARALIPKMTGEERKLLAKHDTQNTEAYRLYLKGRYHWNKRTEEGFRQGIEYFERAIDKDPGYALAYSGLADCYSLLGDFLILQPSEAYPKAKAAAERALETDGTLAEAHVSLASLLLMNDWNWSGAGRALRRAIEINPNNPVAHDWYGAFFMLMGRWDNAIAETKLAEELDPLSPVINTHLGSIFYFARQYDRAIERFQESLEMDPSYIQAHIGLGLAYQQTRRLSESVEVFRNARLLYDTPPMLALLGTTYALSARTADAREVVKQLTQLATHRYVSPYVIAPIYACLGESDTAFQCLEKAYRERSGGILWLKIDPTLQSLHSDPRFINMVRRIGIPQ